MKKTVHLGLSILDISKIVIYEFWYDQVKPKYEEKQNYVTWIQILHSLHKNKRYLHGRWKRVIDNTSNYEFDRLLPKEKK